MFKSCSKKLNKLAILLFNLTVLFSALLLSIPAAPSVKAANSFFPNPAGEALFKGVWDRVDGPIVAGQTSRSWLWGPGPFSSTLEEYKDSSNNDNRFVMYFDKGRMELTNPGNGAVSYGLLVTEMVSGNIQIGDNQFYSPKSGPNTFNIVGDPGNWLTYGRLKQFASLNLDNRADDLTGQTADKELTEKGGFQNSSRAGQQTFGYYDITLGHNIPKVFWEFIGQNGLLYNSSLGGYIRGRLLNPLVEIGYPLTEAYWVRQKVAGIDRDVLVQAFQRRTLTFTPDNPPAYQVEMGNAGRHYASWRYGTDFEDNHPFPSPVIDPSSLVEVVRGKTGKKQVAITLDAGSTAVAFAKEMAALLRYNVKITFFLTGQWVRENTQYAQTIANANMEIANHTLTHPDLTKLNSSEVQQEISSGEALIEQVTGKRPWPLFRFPYGARDQRVIRLVNDLGYRSVFWTYDSLDSVGEPKSADFLISRITGLSDIDLDGAIILMHLGNFTSGEALDPILANLLGRGFQVVTVSDLIK